MDTESKRILAPNSLSLVPRRLVLKYDDPDHDYLDEVELGTGAGFFYEHAEELYLITNWHNLAGRHPDTNQPIHSSGSIPNKVSVQIGKSVNVTDSDKEGFAWTAVAVGLWDEDRRPFWLEHPVHGRDVDVVALPFPAEREEKYQFVPITDLDLNPVEATIGREAFILGYPLGIAEPGGLPIWKRATIATEPAGDIDGLPKVYVDTKTREGMSGAPAIVQHTGFYRSSPEDGPFTEDDYWGITRDFWGVYSGRLGNDEFKAQLGIVWKKKVIEEIIEGEKRAERYC